MRICAGCFKAEDWKSRFKLEQKKVCTCSFCGKKASTVDFSVFLSPLQLLLSLFSKNEKGDSVCQLIERDFAIFSNAGTAKRILQCAIQLSGSSFSLKDNVSYLSEVSSALMAWMKMKKGVVEEFRYFPLINPVDESWDRYFASKFAVIKKGAVFFRGRINEDVNKLYTRKKELGMPPREKARAGRVNPYGIPCLYLTDMVDTTIYELRATHGDKLSIGKFVVKENLNIVDFNYKPLLLDDIYEGREKLFETVREFLLKKQIGLDLSKPVHRYDVKEIEYVPTQYICEYIKAHGADGVMFNSAVHHGGKNLVLFKSDKVRCSGVEVKTVDEPVMRFCQ